MKDKSLFAVILAAGTARRFGSTKLLADLDGSALVTHAVRAAETLCGARSILVVGNDWQAIFSACQPLQGFLVRNPDFETGIAGSLRVGVKSVANHAKGILVLLADQPLITVAHLRILAAAWRAAPESIIASGYAGTAGPPIILPRRDFNAIASLQGDHGAKRVLENNRDRLITIPFENGALDVNEPRDLDAIRNR